MSEVVVDSSIALTWCFDDEATQELSTYDATYLELAMRRELPLLTRDNDLAQAASRLGVAVLPSPPTT